MARRKNPMAVALGRKGGKATARNMTAAQRTENARRAVQVRWEKAKANATPDEVRTLQSASQGKGTQ